MADFEQRLRIKLIPDTSEIDKAVNESAKNAGRKVRDAAKGAAGGAGPARRSDYSPSADPLLDVGTPAQRRAQRIADQEASRRNSALRPRSGPAGASPGPGGGGGVFQKMHSFFGTQPTSLGMQRRMGFGMAKQGLGQLAGGMFTGGGASGIMGGAAGMLGGAAGMAGGPWGMAAAKAAEVVQKVIQTMDAMVAHFSKYNASIGAAAGRFEVEQHKFNVTMGKATAPMLTAWSDMKGKLLEAVSAFAPVIKVVSTMIGNTFKSFGMVFQQVGRVVGTVMDSFKNLAAGVMWVVSRIPGSGMKEMDWGQSKRYVDEALDGEERGQGDFFRSTVGGGHGFGGIPAHKVANAQAKAMTKAQDDLAREKLKKERAKAVLLAMMLPPGLNLAALQAAEDKYEKELAKLDAQGAAPAGGAGGGAGAPAQPAAPVFPGRPAVHERPPPFFGNGIKAETHIEFHQQFKMQHELVVQQMLHQVREAAMASFHDAAIQIRLTGNIACSGLGGIPFL